MEPTARIGQDGGNGGDAPPVQIRVALRSGAHPLLQASVSAAGKQRLHLVDPQGGALAVTANGGPGGSGGRGGRGGRAGSGGMGTPNGNNGSDGSSGRNGFDGSQGRGGSIIVRYDTPKARAELQHQDQPRRQPLNGGSQETVTPVRGATGNGSATELSVRIDRNSPTV